MQPSTSGVVAAILAQRDELALRVRELHWTRDPGFWTRHPEGIGAEISGDTAYQLRTLASAMATGTGALFDEYILWQGDARAYRKIGNADLILQLACLEEVLAEAYPASAKLIANYIESARALVGTRHEEPAGYKVLGQEARSYLTFLLANDRAAAVGYIHDLVAHGASIGDAYLDVLEPAQREIGRLWQTNEITVAQEHFATAVGQLAIAQLYPHVMRATRGGPKLLATCVADELHELGARMVADFFEIDGWDTTYLGANTPTAALVTYMLNDQPDVLALSVTNSFHVYAVAQIIEAVRAEPALRSVRILVGGRPFRIVPDLCNKLGADAFATDARSGVQLGRALLTTRPGSPGSRNATVLPS